MVHDTSYSNGIYGRCVRGLVRLLFIIFWSVPGIIIWQLVNKLATPLHDPLQQSLDIHNDSLIMGNDLQNKALHINMLNNTLLLIGTTVAYGIFFLITKINVSEQQLILQILIIGFVAWQFINLTLTTRINTAAQNI